MSGLRYSLRFKTTLAVSALEDALAKELEGDFSLRVEGMADDLATKSVIASFADEETRDLFKSVYPAVKKSLS